MTKILFDIKRDNGYGKQVYLKGSLDWKPIYNSLTEQKPNMSFTLGEGFVEFDIPSTDGTWGWAVVESLLTSGGTPLRFERVVEVPESDAVINYLDLPEVSASKFFPQISSL